MKTLAGFLAGMVGFALAVGSDGALAATECNTGPPPNAVPLSGTIVGGVVVNAGDFCLLGGATISGGVQVNGPTYGFEPHVPFGGQKDSGTGWREPGTEALDVYSDWKTVYVTHDPAGV